MEYQTVKAQHFELTARWKWQDRYEYLLTRDLRAVHLARRRVRSEVSKHIKWTPRIMGWNVARAQG